MISAMERIAAPDGPQNLMLFLPPGSAKSTYASVLFPPWFLANNPHASILAASHSEALAERWGRRCRNLIEEHTTALGIDTREDNRAAGRWQLAPRPGVSESALMMGEYLAAGANSAIAGFRGDLGIIDDPVPSREAAMSEAMRDKLFDWYLFDFRPRLKPHARKLLIMTRWHEDDLAGRILEAEPDEWEIIRIPMVAEDVDDPLGREIGERLWPDWFTDAMVKQAQSDPAVWLSLYQQRPTSEEGTYWKRAWLHPVAPTSVPPRAELRIYGGSDYAVTKGGGDYTVHAVIGIDKDDRPWLLELWRERATSDVWIDAWCTIVRFFKPMSWAEEHGQILAGVGPFLEREQAKRKAFTERLQFPSRFDKAVRAQSMRSHVATHGLWYSSDLVERAALESELLSFPAGKHDDIHDALGLVGQLLDLALRGRKKIEKAKPKKGDYRQTMAQGERNDRWKTL